jgi:hypothetical protein
MDMKKTPDLNQEVGVSAIFLNLIKRVQAPVTCERKDLQKMLLSSKRALLALAQRLYFVFDDSYSIPFEYIPLSLYNIDLPRCSIKIAPTHNRYARCAKRTNTLQKKRF